MSRQEIRPPTFMEAMALLLIFSLIVGLLIYWFCKIVLAIWNFLVGPDIIHYQVPIAEHLIHYENVARSDLFVTDSLLRNPNDIQIRKISRNHQYWDDIDSRRLSKLVVKEVKRNTNFIRECLNVLNKDTSVLWTRNEYIHTEVPSNYHASLVPTNANEVIQIASLDNPYLLLQYELKKLQYKKQYSSVKECLLFHGTKKVNIRKICSQNFDWRLTGNSTGYKFGHGVAFSPNFTYASHYGDESYINYMILAKVLICKHCIGDKNTIIPPDGVDTTSNGKDTVYVKYDDNTFYPNYMIRYYNYDFNWQYYRTD